MEEPEITLAKATEAWDALTEEKKKEFFFSIVELSQRFEKQIELYKEQVANQDKIIVNQDAIMVNLNKQIANTQKGWDNEKELYAGFLVSIANEIAKGGDMTKLHAELIKFIKLEAGVNRLHTDTKFSA